MTIKETVSFLLEKRTDLQKWIDCALNPEETYPEICAYVKVLDVAISILQTQQDCDDMWTVTFPCKIVPKSEVPKEILDKFEEVDGNG